MRRFFKIKILPSPPAPLPWGESGRDKPREFGARSKLEEFAKSDRPGEGGFVLLEVIIALAIFAFSILALIDGVGNSQRASAEAESVQEATMLIRTKIAEIKLSLNEEIARGAFPDEKEESGSFPSPYEKYKWNYKIQKIEIPLIQPPGEDSGVKVGQATGSSSSGQPPADIAGAAQSMAQIISQKISDSIRELKLTVSWGENEAETQKITITTHLAKMK